VIFIAGMHDKFVTSDIRNMDTASICDQSGTVAIFLPVLFLVLFSVHVNIFL
jgi:hypothetical protein